MTSNFERRSPIFASGVLTEVLIGHAVRVERGANPAFVLRARPAMDVADARDVEVVRLDRRRRRHGVRRETERLERRLELRAVGVLDDDRARTDLLAVALRDRLRPLPSSRSDS